MSIKDKIKEEYVKCKKDPIYFMKKYVKIQHPKRGSIAFELYPFQEDCLLDFKKNRFNVILKSRQLGLSTLTAGYILYQLVFNDNFKSLVIATKQDTAKNLVSKVRYAFRKLPKWFFAVRDISIISDNKLSLELSNGSEVKAVSASEDAGRSEALSLLVIDEAAFIQKIDTIWAAAYSTLSTGGSAIVLSTPNGVGNFFHKTWQQSEQPGSEWHGIKLHWSVHPERDEKWRRQQTELLGPEMAAQECDVSFITSGYTVVSGETLQWYKENIVQDPVERRGPLQEYWIWKYPNYTRDYMVVADVARGDGTDFSTFHVIDVEDMEQVAEFKGKPTTKEFGAFLTAVATDYNNALLVVENANIGWAVLQEVLDRGYQNVYYTYKDDQIFDREKQLKKAFDLVDKSKMVPGFSMSSKTRPVVISKLELHCRERNVIIRSIRTIDELFVFVWNGQRAEARSGYNDDLVMSLSTGLWVRDMAFRLRMEGIELNKIAVQNMNKISPIYNPGDKQAKESWTWKPNKDSKAPGDDLTWLI